MVNMLWNCQNAIRKLLIVNYNQPSSQPGARPGTGFMKKQKMKHFCEYYIPNNPDYFQPGRCILHNCLCDYRGKHPEYDSNNADKQKQCKDYKKWIDPIKQK